MLQLIAWAPPLPGMVMSCTSPSNWPLPHWLVSLGMTHVTRSISPYSFPPISFHYWENQGRSVDWMITWFIDIWWWLTDYIVISPTFRYLNNHLPSTYIIFFFYQLSFASSSFSFTYVCLYEDTKLDLVCLAFDYHILANERALDFFCKEELLLVS